METATIHVGTASWTDHEPFYPPEYDKAAMKSQRISYYARYFDLVEVDSTFYHLQPARNFQMWTERTPPGFVFDVKAFGEMTWHHRDDQGQPVTPSADTFAKFGEMVQPLRQSGKLGAILFQFPPWFKPTEENAEYFGTVRELLPDDTIAVEFRQRAWLEGRQLDETRALLADNNLAYVMVDEPQIGSGSVPPVEMVTDPRFAMVRFHGRNAKMWYGKNLESSRQRFDYLYSAQELLPWAEKLEGIAERMGSGQVHVVTNNNATTKVGLSAAQQAGEAPSALPANLWPSTPQSEAIFNALELQALFGQPIARGEPLPEAVDAAALHADLASVGVS